MKYRNHLSIGYEVIRHKGKTLSSALVSIPYQDFVQNLDSRFKFEEAAITSEVEHRPDLISDVFYDTVDFDWLILLSNNIKDPFESLNIRDRIRLPIL
jgi:hypothetical protein